MLRVPGLCFAGSPPPKTQPPLAGEGATAPVDFFYFFFSRRAQCCTVALPKATQQHPIAGGKITQATIFDNMDYGDAGRMRDRVASSSIFRASVGHAVGFCSTSICHLPRAGTGVEPGGLNTHFVCLGRKAAA